MKDACPEEVKWLHALVTNTHMYLVKTNIRNVYNSKIL